jgi:hypothetical protein
MNTLYKCNPHYTNLVFGYINPVIELFNKVANYCMHSQDEITDSEILFRHKIYKYIEYLLTRSLCTNAVNS